MKPNKSTNQPTNHFLSFWYDSTLDWTPVSRTIDELSTH